ncbi:hypothetical protein [Nocardia sp. NPDC057353]|uniref:hypothetical protein n=1 Tax=Nocardia sp. NPDC057353 TaxID=3346104 RepID=UPI0036392D32
MPDDDFREYLRLPGPARFVRAVAADTVAGKSVVVVFPDAAVRSGLADAVLLDLEAEIPRAAFCAETAAPFPSRVLSTFGADPVADRHYEEWDTVARWEPWHGMCVLLPGWAHADVGTVVDRWPAQVIACGLPERQRPKLLVGVSLAELSRSALDRVDRLTTTVRWWWGVVDRLDTETHLAATSGTAELGPVAAAVIAELAAWDLSCIDFLVDDWDRTTAGLANSLARFRCNGRTASGNGAPEPTLDRRVRSTAVPPADVEDGWRSGRVNRWGHTVRRAPADLGQAEIDQRVWLAHNRTLIPHVDDERAYFEKAIRGRIGAAGLVDVIDSAEVIEIGTLRWLVDQGRVDLGRSQRARLQTFSRLRNKLAHRVPVDDDLLRQVARYLDF